MRKGTWKDRQKVVDILAHAFMDNPSVEWVIRNDGRKSKRTRGLCSYAFERALEREGVYISSDEKGVALCYRDHAPHSTLKEYWRQAILAWNVIGIPNVPKILRRQSYIRRYRPSGADFMYFWFYAVEPGHRSPGPARELKEAIFRDADEQQLPIYLETSIRKNRLVYERYGFNTYHSWDVKEEDITLWFMKREPQKSTL